MEIKVLDLPAFIVYIAPICIEELSIQAINITKYDY